MYISLYVRRGTVYIPTLGRNPDGYYNHIEPVAVVPLNDTGALQTAIERAARRGNPSIPRPDRSKARIPLLCQSANLKTWNEFERNATTWSIDEKGATYRIIPGRRRSDRGWEDDLDNAVILPPGTTVEELSARAATVIQDNTASSSR